MDAIGVFDSGVGGLTVVSALRRRLPRESILYLGDTARLPYGSKSADTVTRYTRRNIEFLAERGVKAVVVACNTASALALPHLTKHGGPHLGGDRAGRAQGGRGDPRTGRDHRHRGAPCARTPTRRRSGRSAPRWRS